MALQVLEGKRWMPMAQRESAERERLARWLLGRAPGKAGKQIAVAEEPPDGFGARKPENVQEPGTKKPAHTPTLPAQEERKHVSAAAGREAKSKREQTREAEGHGSRKSAPAEKPQAGSSATPRAEPRRLPKTARPRPRPRRARSSRATPPSCSGRRQRTPRLPGRASPSLCALGDRAKRGRSLRPGCRRARRSSRPRA